MELLFVAVALLGFGGFVRAMLGWVAALYALVVVAVVVIRLHHSGWLPWVLGALGFIAACIVAVAWDGRPPKAK